MSLGPFVPLRYIIPWPEDIFPLPTSGPMSDMLDRVAITDTSEGTDPETGNTFYAISLVVLGELALNLPGFEGLDMLLNSSEGLFTLTCEVQLGPPLQITFRNLTPVLRISSTRIRAMRREGEKFVPAVDQNNRQIPYELQMKGVSLVFTTAPSIELTFTEGAPKVVVPPALLVGPDLVIEAEGVKFHLSDNAELPPDAPEGFRGIELIGAAVYLPEEMELDVAPEHFTTPYLLIGSGGITSLITATWQSDPQLDPKTKRFSGPGTGTFFDLPFALKSFQLQLRQSIPSASSIDGRLAVPFFDGPVDVELGLTLDGSFTVALSSESGLYPLKRDDVVSFELESLAFERKDDLLTLRLSGEITPLFNKDDINWPAFHVDDLGIDSQGRIYPPNGWINLSNQRAIDFYGFELSITKLGFGQTDDGGKWVGFSGGIKLVEGLTAGASVEGLRVTWYTDGRPTAITLTGVGVEFTIPEVVEFKGEVSYNTIQQAERTIHRFDGAITLKLPKISLEIEAVLVIGTETGPAGQFTFFAIYTGVELPTGIPLGNTSMAIYGFAGLFAYQMEPNKGLPEHPANEGWYENEDGSPGWYKRDQIGVTDLKRKWDSRRDSLALGTGATLGTLMDGGTAFHGKFLLAIVFPGPIIMLEGRGNLLKKRADAKGNQTKSSEPLFRSIAVLDFRLGTLTFGITAWYKYDDKGGLIDMTGSAEAFFDFNNPGAWHIYIGREEPQQYRVHAYIFKKLFEANSYFMLDKRSLKTGAWIRIKYGWSYGPLTAKVEASLDGKANINHRPGQFYGHLILQGNLELAAFGFGVTAIVTAKASADVFKPFHIVLLLSGELKLPWPLPSFKKEFKKEWGPLPEPPPLPTPLKELALAHLRVATTWPLPIDLSLLTPQLTDDDGFLDPERLKEAAKNASQLAQAPAPVNAPVIPLDGRPQLAFGHHMNDDAMVGVNVHPGDGIWERIGDPVREEGPVRVRFGLEELVLDKWVGVTAGWTTVASTKGASQKLYGSWAPVPGRDGKSVSQSKLLLWSKSAFDYTRHGGQSWSERFADAYPEYPCIPPAPEREICCDFSDLTPGQTLISPWQCPDHPEITLTWSQGGDPVVTVLAEPVAGLNYALCFPGHIETPGGSVPNSITLRFPDGMPAQGVTITPPTYGGHARRCLYFVERAPGPGPLDEQGVTFETNGTPGSQINTFGGSSGLLCGRTFLIGLPRPCFLAELTLSTQFSNPANPAFVEARRRSGPVLRAQMQGAGPETLRVEAPDIVELVIHSADETLLHQLCLEYILADAEGADGSGNRIPAAISDTGVLSIVGEDLREVRLIGDERICLVKICATLPPDPAEVERRALMSQHVESELARWYQQDDLLEPDTIYRLRMVTSLKAEGQDELAGWPPDPSPLIQTQYAYFRTEGPPGLAELALPVGSPNPVLNADGKASVQNNAVTVTGNGTSWTTSLAGAFLRFESDTDSYRIKRVTEDSQALELTKPYRGTDRTDATFTITGFKNALDDLTPYVRQTVPLTVPAPGQTPPLPRPVYRAYDTGIAFNVNYVDLMYRMRRRGLAFYLFDNNNRPARDAEGRLIVLANRWGAVEDLTLHESELLWISRVNANNCAVLDVNQIPRHKTLSASAPDLVLDADTVYEARLIPLLLDEDFLTGLGAWRTVDHGDRNAPSNWQIRKTLTGQEAMAQGNAVILATTEDLSRVDISVDVLLLETDTARRNHSYRILAVEVVDPDTLRLTLDGAPSLAGGTSPWRIPMVGVEQRSPINGGPVDGRDPDKPGTMLLTGERAWTDYRFGVTVRSWRDGAIGVVFRAQDDTHYYRFSMSREHRYWRLVRVRDGEHRVLAEDYFVFQGNRDYHILVEAMGSRLRVSSDNELICDVLDEGLPTGGVGLYCWANGGTRFTDARVDDLRQEAPVVYRYQFTTSRFANFFHHLHSCQDETWHVNRTAAELVSLDLTRASQLNTPNTENEARLYDALLREVLPDTASQPVSEVQVTRVEKDQAPVGLLVQSPEPIDWRRTHLQLSVAERPVLRPLVPGAVKLTDVRLGAQQPADEWVDLLVREPAELSGYRLEYRHFPGSQPEPGDSEILFADSFSERESGLVFAESFGPNALDKYIFVDEDPPSGFPSSWSVANNRIEQRGRYRGGPANEYDLPKRPGTLALLSSRSWSNVRIRAVLHSESWHDIGLIFRYWDANNYYRFSISRFVNSPVSPFRRLVKKVGGDVKVLWEDDRIADTSIPCHLVIETYGDRLVGWLNDELLFSLRDPSLSAGTVGFYCWGNDHAYFEELQIEALDADPVLVQPTFQDLGEIGVVEAPEAVGGPADWQVQGGVVAQMSMVSALEGAMEAMPGAAYDIAVGSDGTVAVVGIDPSADGFGVHRWDGTVWHRIAEDAVRITAGPGGGLGWVSRSGQVALWFQGQLRLLPLSATELALGVNGAIWAVGSDPAPGGFTVYSWNALRFEPMGIGAVRIAASPDGTAWVVNDTGQIARYDGTGWQQMPGAATDIAVGADGSVWILGATPVGSDFELYRWARGGWERMYGQGVALSVGQDGNPWVVRADRSIWRWHGSALHQPGTYALLGNSDWQDVQIAVSLRSDSDGSIGMMFRYQDSDNYYRFAMDREEGVWRLIKRAQGAVTLLAEQPWQYIRNQSYALTLRLAGSALSGWLDGKPLFTNYDEDLRRGRVALYCRRNNAAFFERLVVIEGNRRIGRWTIHDDGDQDAPSVWRYGGGALTQTSAIRGTGPDDPGTYALAGNASWADVRLVVRLRSDDPGAIGVIFRYVNADNYYRFALDQRSGSRRLTKRVDGQQTVLWEDAGQSYTVGVVYTLTVVAQGANLSVYEGETLLCKLQDATHQTGQMGLYCTENRGARFEEVEVATYAAGQHVGSVLLEESFETLDAERWAFEDLGDIQGPGQWSVGAGVLRQMSDIRFRLRPIPMRGGPGQPATLAIAGELSWANYRFTVRLGSLLTLGSGPQEIGVVFRYQHAESFYWLTFSYRSSTVLLLRRHAGQTVVLWQQPTAITLGQTYELTVDCLEDNLRAYLEGQPLFDLADGSIPSGRIGLVCTANPNAFFDDVHVIAPIWRLYYAFREEERLPAGRRIRVFSSSPSTAPADPAGMLYRFVGRPGDPGRVHFPADGVDVRLRSPAGRPEHLRRFLPAALAYVATNPQDWRIARNADGTGFFLFRLKAPTITPEASLPTGQYRLALRFLRDNRTADPDSPVLSEAGDIGDEAVTIDIPW